MSVHDGKAPMKEREIYKKAYGEIFGKENGDKLGECAYQMSKLFEGGIKEEDMQKCTRLSQKFQKILEEAGGIEKIWEYNERINKQYGISEKQYQQYYEPMEAELLAEKRAKEERMQREAEAVKRFEEHGILPQWYSFTLGEAPVVCKDECYVYWSGKQKRCEPDEIYDVMLDKLLRYKKQYEFEHSDASLFVKEIAVLCEESGMFYGCSKKGKYQFMRYDMGCSEEDIALMKQEGYHLDFYDQYMGTARYVKRTDDSVFQEMAITVVCKGMQSAETKEAVLIYAIPDELRNEILCHIRANGDGLEIEDYALYEKIIAYFTEERLSLDAENIHSGIGNENKM